MYVEKPFVLDPREAEELLGLAERRALWLTVDTMSSSVTPPNACGS